MHQDKTDTDLETKLDKNKVKKQSKHTMCERFNSVKTDETVPRYSRVRLCTNQTERNDLIKKTRRLPAPRIVTTVMTALIKLTVQSN